MIYAEGICNQASCRCVSHQHQCSDTCLFCHEPAWKWRCAGAVPVTWLMSRSRVTARLGNSTPRLWAGIGTTVGFHGSYGDHAPRFMPRRGNMHIGHGVSATLRQRVPQPSTDSPQVQ